MNLTINSTFRPFTYDELAKPLIQYKEAYDKVEQDYSDLVSQTEMWADIANRENSPEAYAMYQKYSNALNSVVDDFSRGMTLQNRGQLLNMRRRYSKEITPIANAYAAMKEANDYRTKMGADAIFQVGQYNSLDQFLHGKTANNNWQSREALTKKSAAISEAAMAEMARDPEVRALIGNDQYLMSIIHNGGSYKDLQEAMAQAINANPKLGNRFSEIRQQLLKSTGYEDYDAQGQRAIVDAVDTGMYAGLDKPTRNLVANQNFWSDKDRAMYQLSKNADARADKQLRYNLALHGLYEDKNGDLKYDIKKDPNVQKALAVQEAKNRGKLGSGSNRETVSQDVNMDNLNNPGNSTSSKDLEPKGTKLSLSDFKKVETEFKDSTGKTQKGTVLTNEKFDKKVMGKVSMSLAQRILHQTGETTLQDAFNKYEIWFDEGGNMPWSDDTAIYTKPKKNIYNNESDDSSVTSSQNYNMETVGY